MKKGIIYLFSIFFILPSFAATITSNGSGMWSASATWVGGVPPGTTDDVVILSSHLVTLNVNATIASLKIGSTSLVSTLNVDADLTITGNLTFGGGTSSNDGILDCIGSTARTIIINGNVTIGSGSGFRGNINVNNAYHILEIKGNLTSATSTGVNFLSGVCKFTGSTTASFNNGTTTARFADVEIGDGTTPKTFSLTNGSSGAIRFADNKKLTVNNNAIFNLKNISINAPSPSGANFNLVLKNGGTIYDYDISTASTNDIFQYVTFFNNGETDANIETGNLILQSNFVLSSARNYNMPLGRYGNVTYGRIGTTTITFGEPAVNIDVAGSGSRSMVILGNLNAYRFPASNATSNSRSIFYNFRGSATAADMHNVTFELAGLNKIFKIDQTGKVSFGSTNAGASTTTDNDAEAITKISGTYTMENLLFGTSVSTLNFFDLEIPTAGVLKWGPGATVYNSTSNFPSVGLRGNATINGILDVFNTSDNAKKIPTNFGPSGVPITFGRCTWSGNGIIRCYNFVLNAPGGVSGQATDCSINEIQIWGNGNPATGFTQYNFAGVGDFKQTAGSFLFKDGSISGAAGMTELTATAASVKWQFNNIVVDAGVIFKMNCNWSGMGSYGKIIGNITVNGEMKMDMNATGSSPFEFVGTSLQTISGSTSVPIECYNWKINNTNGIKLQRDISCIRLSFASANLIDFTNGVFYGAPSPNGLISFDATGTTLNFTNTGSSFVAGPVKKTGNASFRFPIGDTIGGNKIAPVEFTNLVAITDSYTAQYIRKGAKTIFGTNYTALPTIHHVSDIDYWQVNKNSGTTADVNFFWTATSSNNGAPNYITNLATLGVAHFNGSSWDQMLATGNGIGGIVAGSINVLNQSSFSPFALASINADNPLPNFICHLQGSKLANTNVLHFSTQYPLGTKYILEKSINGINFIPVTNLEPITFLSGHEAKYYDEVTNAMSYFYRVKIITNSTAFSYSNVVSIKSNSTNLNIIGLYPSLIKTTTMLYLETNKVEKLIIHIVANNGQVVYKQINSTQIGSNIMVIPLYNLAKGNYYVNIINAIGIIKTISFIKE